MKLSPVLLLVSGLLANAATEEHITKRFALQPGGTLVVDVDFGSLDVNTNATSEVVVDVLRKVTRATKAEEEAYLADRPVTFSQDGNTITIQSRAKSQGIRFTRGNQRTEGKYTITVPAQFGAQLKTAGGTVAVSGLTGEVKAATSGGGLTFAHLRGPLDGHTSGGPIRVVDCQGTLKVKTSGGGLDVAGGSGTFEGTTSGGPVAVQDFRGAVEVRTSGGGITIENVAGRVDGSTSGGPIKARLAAPPSDQVTLATSGGSVTVRVPENAAFDLDASTSGGGVSSELSVSTTGKPARGRLKGPVNGGGKPLVLRSHGGSIQVLKL